MNKQSNTYTLIYIAVLVAIVGTALAATSIALKPRQQDNADADKMKQILNSVHIVAGDNVKEQYKKYITDSFVIDNKGQKVDGNAFDTDVALQSTLPADQRRLPVFECTLPDKGIKYIIPVYGAGLWGPIWGFVSVNSNGRDIYGAYFAHQSETPGLGAEIEKETFSKRFDGKKLWQDGKFSPVKVVKYGTVPAKQEDNYVDGVSGGTITSRGVNNMLDNCMMPYRLFLKNLDRQ